MAAVAWVLGIDPGRYKTGVAVGQTLTATAKPLAILHTPLDKLDGTFFASYVLQWRPQSMVLGLPELADGGKHPLHDDIIALQQTLGAHFKLPVYLHNEYLSSHEAGKRDRKRRHVDDIAAAVILESWLAGK